MICCMWSHMLGVAEMDEGPPKLQVKMRKIMNTHEILGVFCFHTKPIKTRSNEAALARVVRSCEMSFPFRAGLEANELQRKESDLWMSEWRCLNKHLQGPKILWRWNGEKWMGRFSLLARPNPAVLWCFAGDIGDVGGMFHYFMWGGSKNSFESNLEIATDYFQPPNFLAFDPQEFKVHHGA